MKANRFAMKQADDDEAVSPVIAVILMVAITVVLAATVYVWVSGFGTSGSIKKFPQVVLKDDPTDSGATLAAADGALAKLEHRGGDTITWADYTLNVFENGASTTAVDYDPLQTCAAGTADRPAGAFSVGDSVYICSTAATPWGADDRLKLQIVDNNQNSIVYENEVVLN